MSVIYGITGALAVTAGVATLFVIKSDIQIILASVLILGGLNLMKGLK